MDGDFPLGEHLASGRTQSELDRLIGEAWPGGHADRTDAVAIEWVKRWGHRRVDFAMAVCDCRSGRCLVCN